jgi:hypothetical protein
MFGLVVALCVCGVVCANRVTPILQLENGNVTFAESARQIQGYEVNTSGAVNAIAFKYYSVTDDAMFSPPSDMEFDRINGLIIDAGMTPVPMLHFNYVGVNKKNATSEDAASQRHVKQLNAVSASARPFSIALREAVRALPASQIELDLELPKQFVSLVDAKKYYAFLDTLADVFHERNMTVTINIGNLKSALYNLTAFAATSLDGVMTMVTFNEKRAGRWEYELRRSLAMWGDPQTLSVGLFPSPAYTNASYIEGLLDYAAKSGVCSATVFVWKNWDVAPWWWSLLKAYRDTCVPHRHARTI